eukprot:5776301-Pyramimonas_sp.AAC.1
MDILQMGIADCGNSSTCTARNRWRSWRWRRLGGLASLNGVDLGVVWWSVTLRIDVAPCCTIKGRFNCPTGRAIAGTTAIKTILHRNSVRMKCDGHYASAVPLRGPNAPMVPLGERLK